MKNLKVKAKLMVGFLFVIAFTVVVGVVGVIGMSTITGKLDNMYNEQTLPLEYIAIAKEAMQATQVATREMVVYSYREDLAGIDRAYDRAKKSMVYLEEYLDKYEDTLTKDSKIEGVFSSARSSYEKEMKPAIASLYDAAKINDSGEINRLLDICRDSSETVIDAFGECMDYKIENADEAAVAGQKLSTTLLIVLIAVIVLAIIIAISMALYVSGLIVNPLIPIKNYMVQAGTTGKVSLTPQETEQFNKYARGQDEIAQTIAACRDFVELVHHIEQDMERIATGDLTVDIHVKSATDELGNHLRSLEGKFNDSLGEINSCADQVSDASRQISDGAQSLAQASTEQAASVQELSSSIQDMSGQIKDTAEMAGKCAGLSSEIKNKAETGTNQMESLMNAVREIAEAGSQIEKVIKVIDDIAFQTNILALNAAVEAARAGSAGKGFAVVAEEVRNLASKSAEAAKNTSGLIENSINKANLGLNLATETSDSLREIVDGINNNADIIAQIAESSDSQAIAISQLNIGVEQIANVVQQNSATAEQSAAAAEEMNGQTDVLKNLCAQFKTN
ncbi:MAG: methyl-accepting chemotaxis protein [Oscillospiraceae bacterium]|nr:methyl-accepting chemotaxis protein [Oscillospiraceae bacterium]